MERQQEEESRKKLESLSPAKRGRKQGIKEQEHDSSKSFLPEDTTSKRKSIIVEENPVFAMGFSMGALTIMSVLDRLGTVAGNEGSFGFGIPNHLQKNGKQLRLAGAVAVSVGLDRCAGEVNYYEKCSSKDKETNTKETQDCTSTSIPKGTKDFVRGHYTWQPFLIGLR